MRSNSSFVKLLEERSVIIMEHKERLRHLRIERGWTLEEAGKQIGIKKTSYAGYESGYRNPPLDKLKRLSKVYGVSVDYILGLSEVRLPFDNNLKEFFNRKNIHWDGIPLTPKMLKTIQTTIENTHSDQN
jgi:transcriptional regulator with XRE-family HTH domain